MEAREKSESVDRQILEELRDAKARELKREKDRKGEAGITAGLAFAFWVGIVLWVISLTVG